MLCTILGIDEQVLSSQIKSLSVWTKDGQVTIMDHHEPCLILLVSGELVVQFQNNTEPMRRFIGGGFLEVRKDETIVLADAAENLDQWTATEAESAKLRAEQAVTEAVTEESLIYAKAQLAKSLARLKVVHRKKKSTSYR